MSELDLSTANAGAMADIAASADSAPAAPVAEAAAAPAPTPTPQVDGQPLPEAPATPAPTPTLPTELELKWNGQVVRTPLEQAIKLAQQGFDYTQKTQTLAEHQRQLQAYAAQLQQERSEWQRVMSNPDAMRQHYESLMQSQGLSVDPNEVPTVAQMQQALKAEASRIQQETQTQIQKAVAEARTKLEVSRMESDYTQAADSTLNALKEAHPVLSTIDDVEVLLRQDAWKLLMTRHQTEPDYAPSKEDIQKALKQAGKARAEKLEAKIKEHEKMAVARHAKLTTQGIEPPGGRAVTPQPSPKHKLGSKDLTSAAIADIENLMRSATQ